MMSRLKRILIALGLFAGFFVLIQFTNLLSSFDHTNPPITYTIEWDSPRTEELVRAACYGCHSNETVWPWYSNIAPVSWLVVRDVDGGRKDLNYSTGHRLNLDEMVETIREGEMPVPVYVLMHPEADLTAAEKEELIAGLIATFDTMSQPDPNESVTDSDDD